MLAKLSAFGMFAAVAAAPSHNATMGGFGNVTAAASFSCPEGFRDITNGAPRYWACGYGCASQYMTDEVCNCACQPVEPPCCTSTCGGVCARDSMTCDCKPAPTGCVPTELGIEMGVGSEWCDENCFDGGGDLAAACDASEEFRVCKCTGL